MSREGAGAGRAVTRPSGMAPSRSSTSSTTQKATRCYAWSHAVEGSETRRFVAVLDKEPVTSLGGGCASLNHPADSRQMSTILTSAAEEFCQ